MRDDDEDASALLTNRVVPRGFKVPSSPPIVTELDDDADLDLVGDCGVCKPNPLVDGGESIGFVDGNAEIRRIGEI